MSYVNHLFNKACRMANHIDSTEFLLIVAGVLAVGFVCMRGFGSRTNW